MIEIFYKLLNEKKNVDPETTPSQGVELGIVSGLTYTVSGSAVNTEVQTLDDDDKEQFKRNIFSPVAFSSKFAVTR